MAGLRKIEKRFEMSVDGTDTESVTDWAEQKGARIHIVSNGGKTHSRRGGVGIVMV